jgi:histidinol-phosphate aminotransferase
MYAFDTEVCGGQLVSVPRCEDFSLDIAAIEQAAYETNAKVLFVASPNNPSGNTISHTDMERLLELPLLVVVDEAYIEFTAGGVSDWVGRYENLAVLRTFSKWAGLAGLRVGYGLLPEELAREIWKIKQPYNVNLAAQVAALASLEDVAYLRGTIERIVAERERVLAALSAQPGLHVYPSQTNFLLCRVLDGDALHLKQTLAQVGVLVRHYRKAGLSDCLRVSIGRPEQNDRFLAALNVAQKRPKEA